MVLDVLKEKFGSRNCIHVLGHLNLRKSPGSEDPAGKDAHPKEPAYDPAIHELAHDDAEFGPGVHELNTERTRTDMNKSFVNIIR